MKCVALGLSSALIVFLAVSESAAQNVAPAAAPAETTTPPQTSATAPIAPTTTSPNPGMPNAGMPNAATPNPGPAAISAPNPTVQPPQYQYPYPSYGYANPYGGYGWGMPPKELAYDGKAIPYGYRVEERYNLGLLISGPTLFGLSYALTAYSANEKPGIGSGGGFTDHSPWDTLYIPVVGPFAFANYSPGGSGFIYVFEGLGQITGIGLFLLGILRPKDYLVRNDLNEAFRPSLQIGPGRVHVEMRF